MDSTKTAAITSYDLLKTLAVITMIIDHIGYYFFPEELMFRAIGRVSFPIWFFLIGYANSRDIGPRLIGGALILALADGIVGLGVIPLNILFTIILIRLIRERVAAAAFKSEIGFFTMPMLLMALALPSYLVMEYGTHGLLAAMFGWMARNRPAVPGVGSDRAILVYLVAIIASYSIQQVVFGFGRPELLILGVCLIIVMGWLYSFRPASYPGLTARCPKPLAALLRFMGRRTLEIYVGHLLLFKLWGVIYAPERFPLSGWQWTQISF